MNDLVQLTDLIQERNSVGARIASIIGRPATIGHAGEYIASKIFGILLTESASSKAIDGFFTTGSLEGKSVNIKWYGRLENILDVTPDTLPDFYLVMTGPKDASMTSKGGIRPWVIEHVFIFESTYLVKELANRGINIGIATSVANNYWQKAEIYPIQRSEQLILNESQKKLLGLFGAAESV